MTGFLIFIFKGKASQIVFAMLISALSVVAFVHWKPFMKDENDSLAIVSQVAIFFTLFAALLKKVEVDKEDKYDEKVFGFLLIAINCMGIGMSVSGFFVKPMIRMISMLSVKHIHSAPLKGIEQDGTQLNNVGLLAYFKQLAKSDVEMAAWMELESKDWGMPEEAYKKWASKTKAKAQWRSGSGAGIIDQFRLCYEVDVELENLLQLILLLGKKKCTIDKSVLEAFVLSNMDDKTDIIYNAKKMHFFLNARDFVYERTVVREDDSVFVVARSVSDENAFSLKKSHSLGRTRGIIHLAGYLLKRAGNEKTSVIYIFSGSVQGFIGAFDIIARKSAIKSFKNTADSHYQFALASNALPLHGGCLQPIDIFFAGRKIEEIDNSRGRGASAFDAFSGFARRFGRTAIENGIGRVSIGDKKSSEGKKNDDNFVIEFHENPMVTNNKKTKSEIQMQTTHLTSKN